MIAFDQWRSTQTSSQSAAMSELQNSPEFPATRSESPGPRGPLRRFIRKALGNWLERHQHPFNRSIHLLGIPIAVAGVVLLFFLPWYWGVRPLVLGYALQYAAHALE